jgi:hypothetical protein
MGLHMALQAADLLLQTPSRVLKCIVDRKINVGVALVGIRLVANIHLFFIRQSEADMDLEKTAAPMMLPWTFQHDATGGDSTELLLKPCHMSRNSCAQYLLRFHSLKFDVCWGFHFRLLDCYHAEDRTPASNQAPMRARHIDLDQRYVSRQLSVVDLHIGAL